MVAKDCRTRADRFYQGYQAVDAVQIFNYHRPIYGSKSAFDGTSLHLLRRKI